jgi:DNA-directed RNA polymerase specialized sigma24 family protein
VPLRATTEDGLLRAAFRDLHGARLHGYALLVTLGDRHRAAQAASEALAAGARRAAELRHPERAAAWLRVRVNRAIGHRGELREGPGEADRRAALAGLGVDGTTYAGLAQLDLRHRTALVAAEVERLEPLDVEVILGVSSARAQRMVARARSRYLAAGATGPIGLAGDGRQPGELAGRVRRLADATFPTRGVAR